MKNRFLYRNRLRAVVFWEKDIRDHSGVMRVYFLLKKQFSHFFEIRQCGLIISFTEAARPDGVLIELNPLFKWLREHHCAYPAVSKGQCFVPIVCRGLIPKKCGSIHSYSFRYLYFNMVVGYNPLYYSIFCLG